MKNTLVAGNNMIRIWVNSNGVEECLNRKLKVDTFCSSDCYLESCYTKLPGIPVQMTSFLNSSNMKPTSTVDS